MILFVDTSALIAISIKRDQNHNAAVAFLKTLTPGTRFITSSFVLDETISHLNSRSGAQIAYQFGYQILQSSLYEIIDIDKALFFGALQLLKKFHDQNLSFTDLTSFALMRLYKISTAFCFDHDFVKAGFEIVPQ